MTTLYTTTIIIQYIQYAWVPSSNYALQSATLVAEPIEPIPDASIPDAMSPPSFIDSGFTTRVEYEKWLAANPGATTAPASSKLVVRGMAISHNVIPAVMAAMDIGTLAPHHK